jgi:hypothetical protein
LPRKRLLLIQFVIQLLNTLCQMLFSSLHNQKILILVLENIQYETTVYKISQIWHQTKWQKTANTLEENFQFIFNSFKQISVYASSKIKIAAANSKKMGHVQSIAVFSVPNIVG